MPSRRSSAFIAGLSLIAAGTAPAIAGPLASSPPVQVSGTSAFAGCTADDVDAQSGQVFLHSEVEPWIDVNPTDPDNIVGIWQQDRWSNGGARGLVAAVTKDGGAGWQQVVIPGISLCSGGDYDRSTDPWVTFGPDGTLHQLALSFNDVAAPFEPRDFDHALLASRSTDGGLTWSDPVEVIRDLDANVFNDKQSITADPTDADLVYGVWDRLVFPPSERAAVISGFVTAAFRGPAWFARSTDGGLTWEPAREIYDPGQNDQTIGNQIVVLPDGTLVDVFNEIRNDNRHGRFGGNVALIRSGDSGTSWSRRIVVDRLGTIGITDPDTGHAVRTGDIIPEVAVDPTNAALYVVWQDARFSGGQFDSIAFSESLDGGLTWSAPIKVNLTLDDVPPGNQQAFTPSVHVAADGTIGVTYYDFRNNTASEETLPTDYFLVHCHPSTTDCTDADSWTDETQITATSFDMQDAPDARGFFTGDYEGLSNVGDTFTPFFSQPHGSDPSSTFFAEVG
jgi:hypothetical protein